MSTKKSKKPEKPASPPIPQINDTVKFPIFQIDYSFIEKQSFTRELKNTTKILKKLDESEVTTPIQPEQKYIKHKFDTNVYTINLNKVLRKNDVKAKEARRKIRKSLKISRTHDLVHSIVALFDCSLPDIGAQYIYECICARKAYTIFLFKDVNNDDDDNDIVNSDTDSVYEEKNDCLSSMDVKPPLSVFHELFQTGSNDDTTGDDNEKSNNDDDSDDDEDDEDFTLGVRTFIENYKKNPTHRQKHPYKRLIACATLERINTSNSVINSKDTNNEWIIVLQLMCVQKQYRGYGIGNYLINFIKSNLYVGIYDAIITSSDEEAIDFYVKHGFSDNPILNSKYKKIGDVWTNTTKMCFIPPYLTDRHITLTSDADKNGEDDEVLMALDELNTIDSDFTKWNKIMFNAYQTNVQIFAKLKQEIINLRVKLCAQNKLINTITERNKYLEKELYSLNKMDSGLNISDISMMTGHVMGGNLSDDDADLDKLISELKLLTTPTPPNYHH